MNLFLLAKEYGISVETEMAVGERDPYIFFIHNDKIGEHTGDRETAAAVRGTCEIAGSNAFSRGLGPLERALCPAIFSL
jgi:hypothetical protein